MTGINRIVPPNIPDRGRLPSGLKDQSTGRKCRDCGREEEGEDLEFDSPFSNCEYCEALICEDCDIGYEATGCKYCCYDGISVAVAEELKYFFKWSKVYLDDPDTDSDYKLFSMSALLESTEIAIRQANDIYKSGYPQTKES